MDHTKQQLIKRQLHFFHLFLYSHSLKETWSVTVRMAVSTFTIRTQVVEVHANHDYDTKWENMVREFQNTLYIFICNPTFKHIVVGAPVRSFLNDVRATIFYYYISYLLDYYWYIKNVSVGANYHRNFFSLFINKVISVVRLYLQILLIILQHS